jgi:hypothetical protein
MKLFGCIEPKLGFNILGLFCIGTVLYSVILILVTHGLYIAYFGCACFCFGIPAIIYIVDRFSGLAGLKKCFAYTFLILMIMLKTAWLLLLTLVATALNFSDRNYTGLVVLGWFIWFLCLTFYVYLFCFLKSYAEVDNLE